MPSEPNYHTQLRDLLLDHFSLPELRGLAFELGIDLDDVRGDDRPMKAQELVARLGREGKWHRLAALCRQKRPDAFWPNPPDEPAAPQSPIYGPLPPPVPHFVGRQDEIAWLQTQVRPGRVVVLCAAGGMGKTTVAVRAVRGEQYSVDSTQYSVGSTQYSVGNLQLPTYPITQLPFFPDGILFYTFYGRPSAQAAMEEMCRWLGADPRPDAAGVLQGLLGRRRLLLLLDGAEACDDLEAVLAVRGMCGVLITTRDRKQLWGCDAWRELKPLPEAVQLLQQWGGVWAADTKVAEEICRLVGKLPLAVQLVGNYLVVQQQWAAEYLARLHQSPMQALHQGEEQEFSVPYLLGRSLEAVGEAGQAVLSAVGALALAPFPANVAQVSNLRYEGLEALGRYGLVVRRGAWYEVSHALVYTYAHEQLPATPPMVAGLAEWLNQVVREQRERGLPGYQQLDPLRPHVLACLAACVAQQQWAAANQLVWAVQNYLDIRGYATERRTTLEVGIQAAKALNKKYDEMAHIGHLGLAYAALGQVETAVSYHQQALIIAHEIGDKRGEGNHLGNLGNAYRDLGQVETAVSFYQQALIIAREIKDKRGEGSHLGNLGLAYSDLGQVETAVSYTQQALTIAQEISDKWGESNRLGNLGIVYRDLGQVETAVSYTQQALTIAREIGDKRGEGVWLSNLGLTYADLGQVETAIKYHQQGLNIAREIGARSSEAHCLDELGTDFKKSGELETATSCYREAITIFQEIGNRQQKAMASWNLGEMFEESDPQQAVELMSLRVAYEREIGHPDAEKHAKRVQGIVESF